MDGYVIVRKSDGNGLFRCFGRFWDDYYDFAIPDNFIPRYAVLDEEDLEEAIETIKHGDYYKDNGYDVVKVAENEVNWENKGGYIIRQHPYATNDLHDNSRIRDYLYKTEKMANRLAGKWTRSANKAGLFTHYEVVVVPPEGISKYVQEAQNGRV